MTHTQLRTQIQTAIGEDQVNRAFDLLATHLHPHADVRDEYLTHSAGWKDLQKQKRIAITDLAYLDQKKNHIRSALLEIAKALQPADLRDPEALVKPALRLPILVICKDEIDEHYMRDFFSRLDFQDVRIEIRSAYAEPAQDVRILVFANHTLVSLRDNAGRFYYEEADQARIALMEQYLTALESARRFTYAVHFGGNWAGRDRWLDWANAANSRFTLYARLREVADFMIHYRKEGEYE